MPRGLVLWLAVLVPACAGPHAAPPADKPPSRQAGPPPRPVELRLFVMSKCPHSATAERMIRGIVDALGPTVRLKLDYIVDQDDSGKLRALHGPSEVRGNILQLCALRHAPDRALAFIDCLNRDLPRIPDNWEACATQTGVPAEKLMSCYTSPEGKQLLRASMQRARTAGVTASPTIHVAGQPYDGPRSSLDLMRALCAALGPAHPPVCKTLPKEVAVSLLVLSDRRCKHCDTQETVQTLRERLFHKLRVRHVDYGTAEGKGLYGTLGLHGLPALLFDADVERHHRHPFIARFLDPRGEYRLLSLRPRFDPTAEICDNGIDDTADGKIDCADADCIQTLACRREQPRRLELFVMSQCPFAARAVLSMKEVLKNFGGRVSFDLHFIAEKTDDGFRALHGQGEVEENIRQLCAKKHYAKDNRYLGYLWCRYANPGSDAWRACAVRGMSAAVIERCARGAEGRRLLASDIRIARALEITASPTWLANNRHTFHGISAEQIKQGVCRRNPGLGGCENTLSGDADVPGGACGGN